MEILKAPLSYMNNIKKVNQKSGETHARISQKNFTATDRRTENPQKISLFQIFLKIECSRVPIHFKVAAATKKSDSKKSKKVFLNSYLLDEREPRPPPRPPPERVALAAFASFFLEASFFLRLFFEAALF
jgi:hypothetical protein